MAYFRQGARMDNLRSLRVGVEYDKDDRESEFFFVEMKTGTRTYRLVFPDRTEALNFYADLEKKLGITLGNLQSTSRPEDYQRHVGALANYLRGEGWTVEPPREDQETSG